MRHERIKVTRDNNTVHNLTVAPWEISLIEYVFDEGNVMRFDEFVKVDMDYPDPGEEFFRLQKAYGQDPKTEIPHAVTVYGAARLGVKTLEKAIELAQQEERDAIDKPKHSFMRRRRSTSYASDPLMR